MTRSGPILLLAIALLSLGAVAVACDGGADELTADAYIERMNDLTEDLDSALMDIGDTFEEAELAAETDEETIEAITVFTVDSRAAFERFADGAAGLSPPASPRDAHDAYVAATRDVVEAFQDVENSLADEATADGAYEILNRPFESDVLDEFFDACSETRDDAEPESDLDMDCPL